MTRLAPDVEAAAVQYLAPLLGVTVATRVPESSAQTFVRVTLTGGAPGSVALDEPTLLVECWAPTSVQAFALASQARGALLGTRGTFMGGVWVSSVSASFPVNFPDLEANRSRYQFTSSLFVAPVHV